MGKWTYQVTEYAFKIYKDGKYMVTISKKGNTEEKIAAFFCATRVEYKED